MTGIERVWMVVPGRGGQWRCGGLMIALRAAELLERHVPAEVATYRDREPGGAWLDDVVADAGRDDLFVVTWGPHVQDLLSRLEGRRVVYYAQSAGWGIRLPPNVPVVALSRHLMAHWASRAPHQAISLLPPVLDERCVPGGDERDIDVLFVVRKSTPYLRDHLVPALQERCRVHVQEEFIDHGDLIALYRRSKAYVYSSAPATFATGPEAGEWVEGFGVQPLEALACGCAVFSNLHGGLSDYLDPDVNAAKLETYSLAHDVDRIMAALSAPEDRTTASESVRTAYSEAAFHERAPALLSAWAAFFAAADAGPPDIAPLAAGNGAPGTGGKLRRAAGRLLGRGWRP